MPKVQFIEQIENVECGLACLAMIMNYHDVKITLDHLRKKYPAPREGFSFYDLTLISENYNFETNAYHITLEELEKDIDLPCIIHWGYNHFVVLEEIKGKNYKIVDPNYGKLKVEKSEFKKFFTGYVLEFSFLGGNRNYLPKEKEKNIVLKYIFQNKNLLISIILVSLITQMIMVFVPLSTKWLTDEVLISGNIDQINLFGILIGIFAVSLLITSFLRGFLIALIQRKLDWEILKDFMNKMFALPFSFFDNRSSGDLLHRANSSIFVRDIISTSIVTIFIDLLLVLTYTIVMINFSLQLSTIVFAICLFLSIFLLVNAKVLRNLTLMNIQNRVKTQGVLTENIYNIVDIKSLGLEKSRLQLWSSKYRNELKGAQKINVFQTYIQSVTALFQVTVPLIVLWVGGHLFMNNTITLGTLIAFNTISASYISPFISISNNYTQLVSLTSYFSRIKDVLNSDSENNSSVAGNHKNIKGDIEFKNVSFRYNQFSANVLLNLKFKIKQGEKVAIVGPSGAGKSSISRLLLRLYEVTEGEIIFNNVNIKEIDLQVLRSSIGSVLQESKLFSGSISENITMEKKPDQDIHKMVDSAKKANIFEDIAKMPMLFETLISESGNNFSGGQRQRLLIARALYQEPSLLIFDEATSNLDSFTESNISQMLKELMITQVIIAHRLNTIVDADKIIYITDGEVKEIGTHEELIAKEGYYYDLYNGNKRTLTNV